MNNGRSLSSFDPDKVARYETENWIAYYRKQWLKLLRISVGMVGEAFGLSLPQALARRLPRGAGRDCRGPRR